MLAGAKNMHYADTSGLRILDGTAGLWCCNAGREPIVAAIREQAATLDFVAPFQFSHPKAFQLASRRRALRRGTQHDHLRQERHLQNRADERRRRAARDPRDVVLRQAGDTIVLTPPLIAGSDGVAKLAKIVGQAIAVGD